MASSIPVQPHPAPSLRRNRAFLTALGGTAVAQLGTSLYPMILPVWVMQTTGSAARVAALSSLGTTVRLLAAPLAGTVADRSDRRAVMALANLARAAIVALLALALASGHGQFPVLAIGSAALVLAGAFFSPACAGAPGGRTPARVGENHGTPRKPQG
ncbi:MAG: hypothetical protein A6D92_05570 [Symbiobacterium thermophilum]|uniref:Major facilitator superfamily (MFS) profile domain-containing protein n=1 Tax=Symbiobacterium thermophilum TaxID=2734 RepID=A0A1Y2T768_SYMTR|nr:MAG: hypothetical protein A6D92_05570 [Symbiobacterium thermophilum]